MVRELIRIEIVLGCEIRLRVVDELRSLGFQCETLLIRRNRGTCLEKS